MVRCTDTALATILVQVPTNSHSASRLIYPALQAHHLSHNHSRSRQIRRQRLSLYPLSARLLILRLPLPGIHFISHWSNTYRSQRVQLALHIWQKSSTKWLLTRNAAPIGWHCWTGVAPYCQSRSGVLNVTMSPTSSKSASLHSMLLLSVIAQLTSLAKTTSHHPLFLHRRYQPNSRMEISKQPYGCSVQTTVLRIHRRTRCRNYKKSTRLHQMGSLTTAIGWKIYELVRLVYFASLRLAARSAAAPADRAEDDK